MVLKFMMNRAKVNINFSSVKFTMQTSIPTENVLIFYGRKAKRNEIDETLALKTTR